MKVGVIGVGHLGRLHTKMYSELDAADLIGVFDVNPEKANAVAEEFNTRSFESLDSLIENMEACSIVTTTPYHFDIAKKCLDKGVHVFIEKPITRTVEEAKTLIELAKRLNLKVQVGHIERFNPAILALEKYSIQPLFIESHRLAQFKLRGSDVAVVLDLMIHDIDIILHLVRSKVDRIDANGVGIITGNVDIANARIQFENGCVANVTASRISQRPMRKMRIFQPNAYLSIDFSEGSNDVFRLIDGIPDSGSPAMMLGEIETGDMKKSIIYEQPEIPKINALKHELELFLQAIENDSEPPVTGEDGLQALEVAEHIIKQIEINNQNLLSKLL